MSTLTTQLQQTVHAPHAPIPITPINHPSLTFWTQNETSSPRGQACWTRKEEVGDVFEVLRRKHVHLYDAGAASSYTTRLKLTLEALKPQFVNSADRNKVVETT